MSYEAQQQQELQMPVRAEIEQALLSILFKYNGHIKEFASGEKIVGELANYFNLNEVQRLAQLETFYHKEQRIKKVYLWHRLLFRAADSLAHKQLVSRPSATLLLTGKREWMLTENGYDEALNIANVSLTSRESLPVVTYEVQEVTNKIINQSPPIDYVPIGEKRLELITKEVKLRSRGFRQAVIKAYDYQCAVCGLRLQSPTSLSWEVEAAHIIPHTYNGKDDIWNGIALCRLHHWAFDVGWFTVEENFQLSISTKLSDLPANNGRLYEQFFLQENNIQGKSFILAPKNINHYPHQRSIKWHRENVFIP